MNLSARVESIDALKAFRPALIKFAETAKAALNDAEAELRHTHDWLEQDRQPHWKQQIRKRTEAVALATDALRQKKLYKSPTGARPSTVDEEKALALAKRRLEEAQFKYEASRRWLRRLEKEIPLYKGQVRPVMSAVESDVPNALAGLDRMIESLEAYLAVAAPSGDASSPPVSESVRRAASDEDASMARDGQMEEQAPDDEADEADERDQENPS